MMLITLKNLINTDAAFVAGLTVLAMIFSFCAGRLTK